MSRKVELKSDAELQKMRQSGILLRKVFDELGKHVVPGVSTAELDRVARRLIEAGGAKPAFLGYMGYPATLCTSVNDEVVHGIPSARPLVEGDIVSIDCGLVLNGFYADTATTYPLGNVSPATQQLLAATRESLDRAIEQMFVGNRIGTVSSAVQQYVEERGYSVVRDYTGHGIGRAMHEPPQIPNFGEPDTGFRLRPGLVLAIEPMVNAGTYKTKTLKDGWTVVTADGALSAHFEHTVAVTEAGPYVLTA